MLIYTYLQVTQGVEGGQGHNCHNRVGDKVVYRKNKGEGVRFGL